MAHSISSIRKMTTGRPFMFSSKNIKQCRHMAYMVDTENYQFMQRSKLPTMYFQRSLPRLPIPQLEKSCDRFLNAVKPILTMEQYQETETAVTEFRKKGGIELNALLKQQDSNNKHTSYISELWFDMYLSDRARLPLNCNPLLMMNNDPRSQYQAQLVRAANLVISSLRFWRSLQAGILEPEIYHLNPKKSDTDQFRRWMRLTPSAFATYAAYAFKAFPLDQSQYGRLFGVSRIPELGKDSLVQCADSRHILIMRRGNMYAVDVLNANGEIEQPNVILGRLQAVLKIDEERGAAEVPLGVLTGEDRDCWARTRTHLISSKYNKQILRQEVDAALFCLCLDGDEDPDYDEKNPIPIVKHLLASNGRNRWFDKSVSLLITANGSAAVNFEHSWGDGVAVLRYFNEIYKETIQRPFVDATTAPAILHNGSVRTIELQIDERVRNDVSSALAKNNEIMKSFNMHFLRYPHLNKVYCKNDRLSPDSIMQLAFQLAYRQAFKEYVGTYESCSTAAFRHGRTEAIRPCTVATKKFCDSILMPESSRPPMNELRVIINECSTLHGQLTKEAAMGQGFDRHLYALKNMAVQHQLPIPELFNTKGYSKINYNIISTSTLASDALLFGAFGPVVQNGLGLGYSIRNEECGAIVSSYEKYRDGKLFIDSLEEAFNKICNVVNSSRK